jgi:hypothetical protein
LCLEVVRRLNLNLIQMNLHSIQGFKKEKYFL